MARERIQYACRECGAVSSRWLGRCPVCEGWQTMEKAVVRTGADRSLMEPPEPLRLHEISAGSGHRIRTGIAEMDRVLGGGMVADSAILIAGDPGIGKSTLLLDIARRVSSRGTRVMYVSGEESPGQIKMRAARLGVEDEEILVLAETDARRIHQAVERSSPALVIVDSVQTLSHPALPSGPGGPAQVRGSVSILVEQAKARRHILFAIGHVTKDGAIAGPKVLEHMVDTVLHFEGDRDRMYRIIRCVKNRFGAIDELGVFRMSDRGLEEVPNPSALFLSDERGPDPGAAIVPIFEGTRTFLVEVQALVTGPNDGSSTRRFIGPDPERVLTILAILRRDAGINVGTGDVFVNVVGGAKISEPAADLAVAMAITSAGRCLALPSNTVFIGEIGLRGEIRNVPAVDQRIREAEKLGFTWAVIPRRASPERSGRAGPSGGRDAAPGGGLARRDDSPPRGESMSRADSFRGESMSPGESCRHDPGVPPACGKPFHEEASPRHGIGIMTFSRLRDAVSHFTGPVPT